MERELDIIYNKIKAYSIENDNLDQLLHQLNEIYDLQISEQNKNIIINNITKEFVYSNIIFYNKTSKIYFNYSNSNYLLLNEDNMLHNILYFITNFKDYRNNIDMSLKNLTKYSILRTIKANSIYDTIPDTETIQSILNVLVPTIFETKIYAKIFLITIGNIVLKKHQINTNDEDNHKHIIFMRSNIKPFLNELNKYISMYFGNNNVFNTYKFKYTQDHESYYKWLIPCKSICYDMFNFKEQFCVNLICVSIYYSNRYKNVEDYLNSIIGIDITNVYETIFYYMKHNKKKTIKLFEHNYLIKKSNGFLDEKELIFLWKQHVQKNDLFVHIFTSYQDFLVTIFDYYNQEYKEDINNNILKHVYSMDIPNVQLFRSFWDENFIYCEDEYYFEISEILHLFHENCKTKKTILNEEIIYMIIQVYYQEFTIINKKSIHNLSCKLWNKKKEIDDFILNNSLNVKDNIHMLYKKYSVNEKKLKISKKYFTNYIEKITKN